ncbi:odorant receptor 47b-like [Onthophagus taurus]|uniref:odorant receptor 47b-like n=1 Tax=Onthophagus taurus TaxID=166361 RepID=UPI0039BE4091
MLYLLLLRNIYMYAGIYGEKGFSTIQLRLTRLAMGILFYYGFGMLYNLIKIIADSGVSLGEKCNCLLACATYLMMFSNYILLYIKRHEHRTIFKIIQCFDNFGNPQNLEQEIKFIDRLCFLLSAYCGFAAFTATLEGFREYESCVEVRADTNRLIYCGFVVEVSYPFYELKGSLYYIHTVIQAYIAFHTCFCGCQALISSIATIELIIIRINHLKQLVRIIVDENEEDEIQYNKLRICILYHIHIIDLTGKVNSCYKSAITIVLLGYAINVGCSMIAFFEEYSTMAMLNLVGWTFTVYLVCRSGQRLHDKSLSIGDAFFDLNWLTSKKQKLNIQFVILRANKPLTYETLWGLGAFLFETYMKIMSAAYRFTSLRTGVTRQN